MGDLGDWELWVKSGRFFQGLNKGSCAVFQRTILNGLLAGIPRFLNGLLVFFLRANTCVIWAFACDFGGDGEVGRVE